ncbi:hypothetical protein AJ78_08346 [Emergomyces pasteurianus Ep9510]|uniref:Yeast cell wall synthesis Kre9/Knh1-like N-terminal domain-containing protein n=1 Tax=Emergomyces pasteurianus Ep9510 TaxID=1447872 RepID=A0A1J9P3J3_9EURO|nr:hypothetical protein AJ78_08346 [Emergomyces pasteurianus Ep9510]
MRSVIFVAISAFAAFVAAQSSLENPFKVPAGGYNFNAGKPTTVTWDPTTDGTVTLKLQKGSNITPSSGIILAAAVPNSGSFSFTPDIDLGPGSDYTIQIVDDADPDKYNFTPKFSISGTTGTATDLTPTATDTSGTTTKTKSTTTTATSSSASTTTTESTASSSSSSTTSTRRTAPTGEATTAPDPNSEAISLTRPGFMLSAVLALMAFL